jgi:hypothetical protein
MGAAPAEKQIAPTSTPPSVGAYVAGDRLIERMGPSPSAVLDVLLFDEMTIMPGVFSLPGNLEGLPPKTRAAGAARHMQEMRRAIDASVVA